MRNEVVCTTHLVVWVPYHPVEHGGQHGDEPEAAQGVLQRGGERRMGGC